MKQASVKVGHYIIQVTGGKLQRLLSNGGPTMGIGTFDEMRTMIKLARKCFRSRSRQFARITPS